ncbi:MAG: hypothetical protein N3F09_07290 [Bacteroidia bacterium]|nr:hypothetical protein [Bacteroidia bacterium]
MKNTIIAILTFTLLSFGVYTHIPNKTICIKHPDASNLDAYFQKNLSIFFEIKGDKKQAMDIFNQLKKNPTIQSINWGKTTGEFHGVQLTLKKNITSIDFRQLLKSAGAEHLKINNSEPELL